MHPLRSPTKPNQTKPIKARGPNQADDNGVAVAPAFVGPWGLRAPRYATRDAPLRQASVTVPSVRPSPRLLFLPLRSRSHAALPVSGSGSSRGWLPAAPATWPPLSRACRPALAVPSSSVAAPSRIPMPARPVAALLAARHAAQLTLARAAAGRAVRSRRLGPWQRRTRYGRRRRGGVRQMRCT